MSVQDIGIPDPTVHWERIPKLCLAACNGDKNTVLQLLDRNTSVDGCDEISKRTALHWAVFGKCFAAAEAMVAFSGNGYISFESDVLSLDENTLSILLRRGASYDQDNFILRALLVSGANVNAVDKYGRTALHYAVVANNSAAVNILLAQGAFFNVSDCYECTPFYFALGYADEQMC